MWKWIYFDFFKWGKMIGNWFNSVKIFKKNKNMKEKFKITFLNQSTLTSTSRWTQKIKINNKNWLQKQKYIK